MGWVLTDRVPGLERAPAWHTDGTAVAPAVTLVRCEVVLRSGPDSGCLFFYRSSLGDYVSLGGAAGSAVGSCGPVPHAMPKTEMYDRPPQISFAAPLHGAMQPVSDVCAQGARK